MKNTNEAGSKKFFFVFLMKRAENNTSDSRKKTAEKSPVLKKEMTKLLRYGENTMTMKTINEFKTHRGSSVDRVHVTAGRTKTTMATESNKFQAATMVAAIHCTTKRRVTTAKHPVNVINDRLARMSDIYKFFIMLLENVL